MPDKPIITSLGFPLEKQPTGWCIDLSKYKIFKGLSILAGVIGEKIFDALEENSGDVAFLYKVSPNINPELIEFKIYHIQVFGRLDILSKINTGNDHFIEDLVTVFGTLQRPSWWKKLYPESTNRSNEHNPAPQSQALIFPSSYAAENDQRQYTIVLERADRGGNDRGFFLRLSYQLQEQGLLDLSLIPHIVVNDLKNRVYISGSTRMARSVNDNIVSACNRGETEYSEKNGNYSHLFDQLQKTQLGRLERINFTWDNQFSRLLHEETPQNTLLIFKKIFVSFEAGSICNTLINGETITVQLKKCCFNLYLSQLNRVLNININLPKSIYTTDTYLQKMPLLAKTANQANHNLDFSNTAIFLIHHITSEIISFIASLRLLNADSIHTAFVKYGGVIPNDYLETLLEIPADFLFTAGLSRKISLVNKNYFTLSDYFSESTSLSQIKTVLEKRQLDFFPAMQVLAGHMFLTFCLQKEKENTRVLLIEDGGYLAPIFNEMAMADKSIEQVFNHFYVQEPPPPGKFSDWLSKILVGTVEHTRNGFDRLLTVQEKYSTLHFPAFSIAVSRSKQQEESQEVAHSILSAVESILHGKGRVLSQRKVVLLGSRGNIGRFLQHYLESGRLHHNALPLIAVDKKCRPQEDNGTCSLEDVPLKDLYRADLFLGVTGVSLVKKELLERLIVHSEKQELFFASGSTKTEEFTDLLDWVSSLFQMDKPIIRGQRILIEYNRIVDRQSGIDQGGKVTFQFPDGNAEAAKTLYILNDGTPINFLYYGVPTETMDIVLNQLLTVSLGLVQGARQKKPLPSVLHAVDHNIDEWGKPIP